MVFLLWSLKQNSSLRRKDKILISITLWGETDAGVVLVQKGRFLPMIKKAERKHPALLASLGELNRPLRVRPVNVMGHDWWAIDPEDTWPGIVMDLRRLGFESIAWGEEVLVREGLQAYDPQMGDLSEQGGLKPFPIIQPTIKIQREPHATGLPEVDYLDEYDEGEDVEEDEIEPDEDFQYE